MNSTALIPLSGGKAHAIVDEHSASSLDQCNWSISDAGYAVRDVIVNGKPSRFYMHRVIAYAPDWVEVDHINGNPLDNRADNLRLATRAQNARNSRPRTSRRDGIPYKGVYKNWNCATYTARVTVKTDGEKKHIYIGSFKDQESAARAYDAKAKALFGEFANLNFK